MRKSAILVLTIFTIFALVSPRASAASQIHQSIQEKTISAHQIKPEQPSASPTIQINEVMFYPSPGQPEWVELKNTGTSPVRVSGWGLTDEDGNWYKFPKNLPDVPTGDFVVIVFDGQGSANDEYDFSDHAITLHSPPGLVNIFKDVVGQVALYSASEFIYMPMVNKTGGQTVGSSTAPTYPIVSFVAWGADPAEHANRAIWTGLWGEGLFVNLYDIGETPILAIIPGSSVGLLPGSQGFSPDDYVIYSQFTTSQGSDNPIPVINSFDPAPGATIDSATFAISWNPVEGATGYHFQMDNKSDFSSPEFDVTSPDQSFIPTSPIPEGTYYW